MTDGTSKLQTLKSIVSAELVTKYKGAAAQRGRALLSGDTRVANRALDVTEAVWTELSRRDAVDRLRPLLLDEDSGVRLAAASKLLQVVPDDATDVLRVLSVEKTVGLSAAATLEAHRRYGW